MGLVISEVFSVAEFLWFKFFSLVDGGEVFLAEIQTVFVWSIPCISMNKWKSKPDITKFHINGFC